MKKEEKVIKMNVEESAFTKEEIKKILSKNTGVAAQVSMDCKTQVVQQVGLVVFQAIMDEMADRKNKFGIAKIFRIGKAVIKAVETGIQTWRECNKPV